MRLEESISYEDMYLKQLKVMITALMEKNGSSISYELTEIFQRRQDGKPVKEVHPLNPQCAIVFPQEDVLQLFDRISKEYEKFVKIRWEHYQAQGKQCAQMLLEDAVIDNRNARRALRFAKDHRESVYESIAKELRTNQKGEEVSFRYYVQIEQTPKLSAEEIDQVLLPLEDRRIALRKDRYRIEVFTELPMKRIFCSGENMLGWKIKMQEVEE